MRPARLEARSPRSARAVGCGGRGRSGWWSAGGRRRRGGVLGSAGAWVTGVCERRRCGRRVRRLRGRRRRVASKSGSAWGRRHDRGRTRRDVALQDGEPCVLHALSLGLPLLLVAREPVERDVVERHLEMAAHLDERQPLDALGACDVRALRSEKRRPDLGARARAGRGAGRVVGEAVERHPRTRGQHRADTGNLRGGDVDRLLRARRARRRRPGPATPASPVRAAPLSAAAATSPRTRRAPTAAPRCARPCSCVLTPVAMSARPFVAAVAWRS